jgi:hypothetical protein
MITFKVEMHLKIRYKIYIGVYVIRICGSENVRVRVLEVIGPDLASRNSCNEMFDNIEMKKGMKVFIDFAGVSSISRSFAHQYLLRKKRSVKVITELNIPEDIKNMMNFVQKESTRKVISHLPARKEILLTIH